MPWELTVSDRLGSFGFGKYRFKPGIYTVDDEALVAAAATVPGVTTRLLSTAETPLVEPILFTEPLAKAPLTSADMKVTPTSGPQFPCRVPGCHCVAENGFDRERSRNSHEKLSKDDAHIQWRIATEELAKTLANLAAVQAEAYKSPYDDDQGAN